MISSANRLDQSSIQHMVVVLVHVHVQITSQNLDNHKLIPLTVTIKNLDNHRLIPLTATNSLLILALRASIPSLLRLLASFSSIFHQRSGISRDLGP